jgi:hypothetical protein
MKHAIWAIVVALGVSSGCSGSPVAPSAAHAGESSRLAPFRGGLDGVPQTVEEACRDASAAQPPVLIGVPPSPPVLPPPARPPAPRLHDPRRLDRFDPWWWCSRPR